MDSTILTSKYDVIHEYCMELSGTKPCQDTILPIYTTELTYHDVVIEKEELQTGII